MLSGLRATFKINRPCSSGSGQRSGLHWGQDWIGHCRSRYLLSAILLSVPTPPKETSRHQEEETASERPQILQSLRKVLSEEKQRPRHPRRGAPQRPSQRGAQGSHHPHSKRGRAHRGEYTEGQGRNLPLEVILWPLQTTWVYQ